MTAIMTHLLTYRIPSFHIELTVATGAMALNSKQQLHFNHTELCTSCTPSPGPGSILLQVLEGCNELWIYWLDLSRMVPDPPRRWSRHLKESNHEYRTPDCYFYHKKHKYTFEPFLLNLLFCMRRYRCCVWLRSEPTVEAELKGLSALD